jgi:hypothetical protein
MSPPLWYCGPVNDDIFNPSLEDLRRVIFDTEESYWQVGSGDSGLHNMTAERVLLGGHPSLEFFLAPSCGFTFTFISQGEWWLPFNKSVPGDPVVTHYVGGDPLRRPRACFVSREVAWEIVQEFVRTRSLPTLGHWVRSSELDLGHA